MDYTHIAAVDSLQKAAEALKQNGIEAFVAETGADAKKKVFELLPEGAEVMTMTSVTLDSLGIPDEIANSGKYQPVRTKLNDQGVDAREKKRLGAAPAWTIGSVHAVTETGSVLIASNTGSQLPAYAYGADYVVWVVGAQKIVPDFEAGMKRLYEYVLPLESERAQKAYGMGSFVSKLLVVNREFTPGRMHIILVKEPLGF